MFLRAKIQPDKTLRDPVVDPAALQQNMGTGSFYNEENEDESDSDDIKSSDETGSSVSRYLTCSSCQTLLYLIH